METVIMITVLTVFAFLFVFSFIVLQIPKNKFSKPELITTAFEDIVVMNVKKDIITNTNEFPSVNQALKEGNLQKSTILNLEDQYLAYYCGNTGDILTKKEQELKDNIGLPSEQCAGKATLGYRVPFYYVIS